MTLKELIEYSDELVPNAFSNLIKVAMVNQIEAEIMHDVFLLAQEDVVQYSWDEDQGTELFLMPPYTDVYKNYMKAMLYREMGETDRYNNEIELFNESMRNLCRFVAEKIRPANGRAAIEGYYISAYALAVKHGYQGTEKQWLDSLQEDSTRALETVQMILNGEGNIAVSSATANMLRLPHGNNGVVIYADTQEADVPVVYFEGERGDEPTILRGLAPPEKNDDAASKRYVDNAIIAVFGGIENVEEVAY